MAEHRGMTRSADDVVTEFCKLWANPDPDELATWFTEDAVYHNIPMPPAEGRAAIKEFIAGFVAAFDGIDFQVHRQVGAGDVVMNERTDVMRKKGGGEVALPVMGVFEVRDGKIAVWRDYFDMATVTAAFT
jgi:limonene-1,2-epoxide hydrolase